MQLKLLLIFFLNFQSDFDQFETYSATKSKACDEIVQRFD
jgi:hypothetical protein